MATKKFESAELIDLAIVTLALSIFFSFRFPGKATIENWFGYFVPVLILVAFSIFIHELAHHLIANKYLVHSRSRVWWFGIFFGLFLLLLSNGRFIFAALWTITLTPIYLIRPGKGYPKWHPGPYEYAKIAAAGPLANIALAVVAKILSGSFDFAQTLMTINIWIALLNLFPFFTPFLTPLFGAAKKAIAAPYAEGEYVFFGSRPFWVFVFTFTLVIGLCLFFLGILASILIAAISAIAAWLVYFYYFEAWIKPGPPEPFKTWWKK